jgi:serine phosphatase RsbU (regulator of sigma subunit)
MDTRPGDTFYLYTDGFSDQFGELTDKKFKHNQLKKVIAGVSGFPMSRQREVLEDTFYDWKGNTPQIDDVLVFGFRI